MNVERDIPFPFPDARFPPSLGAVVQRTVASGERQALVVIHDDENDWIVQDGVTDATGPGASIIHHIAHVVDRDPSVAETATLPLGHVAWRRRLEDSWTIEEWAYEDG
jgi:hypothetical protein